MATSAAYIDLDEGAAPATPAAGKVRVYAKTDGSAYQKDDAGTETGLAGGGGASLDSDKHERTSGSYSTTSTSFVDVDATNMALTITTGANRVLVGFVGTASCSSQGATNMFTVAVDGTDAGGLFGIMTDRQAVASFRQNVSFTWLSDVLTAASHTFKLRYRTTAGTLTLLGDSAAAETATFWVQEIG